MIVEWAGGRTRLRDKEPSFASVNAPIPGGREAKIVFHEIQIAFCVRFRKNGK